MKALKIALCGATASLMMAGAASANDFSFNVGVASDYVFRGASQTDESPQIFGGVDYSNGMFYAGAWASNVDFGDSTDAEIDLYAGVKPTFGDVSFDFGALYYGYVNEPGGADWAQWEFKAAASMPVGPVTLGAAAYYSPDYTGVGTDESLYIEANASAQLAEKFSLSAAIGNQSVEYEGLGSDDYTTWNLGLTYAVSDHIAFDLRYHDNDTDLGGIYASRGVLTLKAAF